MTEVALSDLIAVAAGRKPADLVLRNGRVVNVFSHEIQEADVAIVGDRIAGVGQYEGGKAIDLKGRCVCPGLIDAHVHIESSLLSVPEFARVVSAHGTTAVVADPHEFANVMGTEGIAFVLRAAKHAPIDVFVMLSSCVPASPLESAGAELDAEDLVPFLNNPWVLGLAEMMNYPGVIHGDPGVLAKLRMAAGRVIDGHAPAVRGRDLAAYASSGIMSDHECTTADEAAEKLRNGLYVMVREGSQTRNLRAILPLIRPEIADRFLFCTDDKDVSDLLAEGQIDFMIRTAIAGGIDPILAVKMGSLNTARYFGMRQTGAILPGYLANIAIFEDLKSCRVTDVFHRGVQVAADGRCVAPQAPGDHRLALRSSINVKWIEPGDFQIRLAQANIVEQANGLSLGLNDRPLACPTHMGEDLPHKDIVEPANGRSLPDNKEQAIGLCHKVHVIQVLENRIDTERCIEPATVCDGCLVADPSRDLAKIVVIERHRASGEMGRAFVRGFGLKAGAIASTVAHDAHNLIVVGTNDDDMMTAAVRLVKLGGGWIAVRDGEILAELPLPIAGLVSAAPAEKAAADLEVLLKAVKSFGCPLAQPFMALSFLSLSVIGKLKLTNQGLIDVEKFKAIPLVT